MESQVNYSRVGIFISVGLVCLVVALLWLSKVYTAGSTDLYVIYFGNHSLDGLQKDSVVSMKGIRVGSVKNYKISAEDIQKVEVLISLDRGIPVKTDSRAVLRRNLLTGLAKIDLVGGTQGSELLKGHKHALPEIKEDITDFDRIADSVPELLNKIESIAGRLTSVLSDENLEHFNETLDSLNKFTKSLSNSSDPLANTLKNIEDISLKLANVISEVEKASVSKDGAPGLGVRITNSLQGIEELLSELRALSGELGPEIRTFTRKTSGIGRDVEIIADSMSKLSDRYGDPAGIFKSEGESKGESDEKK